MKLPPRARLLPPLFALATLIACGEPASPPGPPGPCDIVAAETPGPASAERAAHRDQPARVAELFLNEGYETGDAGFYTLAAAAAACALERDPADLDAANLAATARLNQHRFAEAEAEARALTGKRQSAEDWALVGDAAMEQGRLDEAADAYQRAVDLRPSPGLYGRISHLRWLWGDATGAEEMAALAAQSAGGDAELAAFHLAWLGWLRATSGRPAPEIDQALALDPGCRSARIYRARLRLLAGDTAGALADLDATPRTFENLRIHAELDPATNLTEHCELDHRGCALAWAPTSPEKASHYIEREWAARKDAHTRAARALIGPKPPDDPAAEARAAVATGTLDPEVLYMAGRVLGDAELLRRALATGPGLLPSQRAAAQRALDELSAAAPPR